MICPSEGLSLYIFFLLNGKKNNVFNFVFIGFSDWWTNSMPLTTRQIKEYNWSSLYNGQILQCKRNCGTFLRALGLHE